MILWLLLLLLLLPGLEFTVDEIVQLVQESNSGSPGSVIVLARSTRHLYGVLTFGDELVELAVENGGALQVEARCHSRVLAHCSGLL